MHTVKLQSEVRLKADQFQVISMWRIRVSRKMEEYNDQETDKISKKCGERKAAYAYAGLMLTACILTYKLYFASGAIF